MAERPTEREGEASTVTGQIRTGGKETAQLSIVQSRRKGGGFHYTQGVANIIYFRNSVHVLESTNQSDTTLGQATLRCSSDQSPLENGKELRRTDDGLLDYNDPQGPNPRHLYHFVGRPRNGKSNDERIQAKTDLVIFTQPSMTLTLKPLGTRFFPSSVVFSCSQYGLLLSAALGS